MNPFRILHRIRPLQLSIVPSSPPNRLFATMAAATTDTSTYKLNHSMWVPAELLVPERKLTRNSAGFG